MKKKKHISERLPAWQFILISGIVYAIASGLGAFLSAYIFSIAPNFISGFYTYSPLNPAPAALMIISQAFLFKFQFQWSSRRWLAVSSMGILGMIVCIIAYEWLYPFDIFMMSFFQRLAIIQAITLGLAQLVVLRRYIKLGWFWVAILVGLSMINFSLYFTFGNQISTLFDSLLLAYAFLIAFISVIHGISQGIAITLLVRLTNRLINLQINGINKHNEKIHSLIDNENHALEFSDEKGKSQHIL